MAQTIMVFDFGTDEEAAQQARLKIDGWKQGFRLGNKILLKFDRPETADAAEAVALEPAEEKKSAKKKSPTQDAKKRKHSDKPGSRVRVMVKLGFSDHEKLTLQRWIDRIPSEEPFKSAKAEIVRQADTSFGETAERFDSID